MRIGINISDELLKRMEPLKTVTNVSQICRDAIKRHVEAYERALKQAKEDGIEPIAERLSNMLLPQEVDWELLGIEDGKMWVQLAKVDDFEYLLERLEVVERQGRSPYEVPIPRLQGDKVFEEHSYEHNEWFDKRIEAGQANNPYVEAKLIYQRGKVSYILAVWKMAKKKAQEKYEKEISTRNKIRKDAQNQINVPNNLLEN